MKPQTGAASASPVSAAAASSSAAAATATSSPAHAAGLCELIVPGLADLPPHLAASALQLHAIIMTPAMTLMDGPAIVAQYAAADLPRAFLLQRNVQPAAAAAAAPAGATATAAPLPVSLLLDPRPLFAAIQVALTRLDLPNIVRKLRAARATAAAASRRTGTASASSGSGRVRSPTAAAAVDDTGGSSGAGAGASAGVGAGAVPAPQPKRARFETERSASIGSSAGAAAVSRFSSHGTAASPRSRPAAGASSSVSDIGAAEGTGGWEALLAVPPAELAAALMWQLAKEHARGMHAELGGGSSLSEGIHRDGSAAAGPLGKTAGRFAWAARGRGGGTGGSGRGRRGRPRGSSKAGLSARPSAAGADFVVSGADAAAAAGGDADAPAVGTKRPRAAADADAEAGVAVKVDGSHDDADDSGAAAGAGDSAGAGAEAGSTAGAKAKSSASSSRLAGATTANCFLPRAAMEEAPGFLVAALQTARNAWLALLLRQARALLRQFPYSAHSSAPAAFGADVGTARSGAGAAGVVVQSDDQSLTGRIFALAASLRTNARLATASAPMSNRATATAAAPGVLPWLPNVAADELDVEGAFAYARNTATASKELPGKGASTTSIAQAVQRAVTSVGVPFHFLAAGKR